MQQTNRNRALGYLAQAQALLPRVGIDDNPGDGGPADGKLLDDEMGRVYVGIAKAQVFLGQEAAAKATLLKAQALVPEARDKRRVRHALLDALLDAYVDLDWLKETAALHSNFPTYPERVLRLFTNRLSSFPEAQARAMLQQGVAAVEKAMRPPDRVSGYATLIAAADDAGLKDDKARLIVALGAVSGEFLARDGADYRLVVFGPLCRAVALGAKVDQDAIERLLTASLDDQPGWAAMGYLHLGREDDAKKALARLTEASESNAFPPSLAGLMTTEAYVALIRRTRNAAACRQAALDRERKLPLDRRIRLLQQASSVRADAVDARDWQTLLTNFAYESANPTAFAQIRARLKQSLPERERYWKSRPGVGGLELSLRQAEWQEIVEQTAKADPAVALRYLPRITEPRRRLPALVAVAEAEAWRGRPRGKGDLG